MDSRRATVSQAQIKRYLKVANEAGCPVQRIEVGADGKVNFYTAHMADETTNDWDKTIS